MLKFTQWPPAVHEVEWTDIAAEQLIKDGNVLHHDENIDPVLIRLMGQLVGSMLSNNVVTGSEAHQQHDFLIPRIAVELTQGWNLAAREAFMDAVNFGAGIEIREGVAA